MLSKFERVEIDSDAVRYKICTPSPNRILMAALAAIAVAFLLKAGSTLWGTVWASADQRGQHFFHALVLIIPVLTAVWTMGQHWNGRGRSQVTIKKKVVYLDNWKSLPGEVVGVQTHSGNNLARNPASPSCILLFLFGLSSILVPNAVGALNAIEIMASVMAALLAFAPRGPEWEVLVERRYKSAGMLVCAGLTEQEAAELAEALRIDVVASEGGKEQAGVTGRVFLRA